MNKKEKSKLEKAQDKAQIYVNKVNEKIEELGKNTENLNNQLNSIQDLFDEIRNVPKSQSQQYKKYKKIQLKWKKQAEKIEKDFNEAMVKQAGTKAAGAGLGVAVASLGPTAAMGIATTFGVASTGTAISALHGIAATNAALAWLGGGTLAAGGGGIAAGKFILGMAGPVGWTIAAVAIVSSSAFYLMSKKKKERIEEIFTLISERDNKQYKLAIVEINERIKRIQNECEELKLANETIKTFGKDYDRMSEAQQYQLGTFVNLMKASTQLLVEPIIGLQPKYSEKNYDDYCKWKKRGTDEIDYKLYKKSIIYFANLLYKIKIDDNDKDLLFSVFKKNTELLQSLELTKSEFKREFFDWVWEALYF